MLKILSTLSIFRVWIFASFNLISDTRRQIKKGGNFKTKSTPKNDIKRKTSFINETNSVNINSLKLLYLRYWENFIMV